MAPHYHSTHYSFGRVKEPLRVNNKNADELWINDTDSWLERQSLRVLTTELGLGQKPGHETQCGRNRVSTLKQEIPKQAKPIKIKIQAGSTYRKLFKIKHQTWKSNWQKKIQKYFFFKSFHILLSYIY